MIPAAHSKGPAVYEFFQTLGSITVTIFVLSSMLNVGLTQKVTQLWQNLSHNRSFLWRMLLLNFVVVPSVMIAILQLVELDPVYETGLTIFGLCAGATFLIRLAGISQADMTLAASVLLVLMVGNLVVLPVILPVILAGTSVDVWSITQNLLTQMILPLVVGMAINQFFDRFAAIVQPWMARISNISLYVLIGSFVIGYLPALAEFQVWKAIMVGTYVLLLSLFLGWMMGDGRGNLKDVGALGTAQRGVAPAMIVAQSNFDDPGVLMIITLVNLAGVVALIIAAKTMSRENSVQFIEPVFTPQRTRVKS